MLTHYYKSKQQSNSKCKKKKEEKRIVPRKDTRLYSCCYLIVSFLFGSSGKCCFCVLSVLPCLYRHAMETPIMLINKLIPFPPLNEASQAEEKKTLSTNSTRQKKKTKEKRAAL